MPRVTRRLQGLLAAAALVTSARAEGCAAESECCEPNDFSPWPFGLAVSLSVLLAPALVVLVVVVASLWLPHRPIAVGAPAQHGDWRKFTLAQWDERKKGWEPSVRAFQRRGNTLEGPMGPHYRLVLTVQGDHVTGVWQATAHKGSGDLPAPVGKLDLRVLTHWSPGRPPGLYGTSAFPGRGPARIEFRVRGDALARLTDPAFHPQAAVKIGFDSACRNAAGPCFESSARVSRATVLWLAGIMAAVFALVTPGAFGVSAEVASLSMPPAGGLWGPAVLLLVGLFVGNGCNVGVVSFVVLLVVGAPVALAAVGTQLFGVAIIEEADFCGPPLDVNGTRTLVGRFCNDGGDVAWGCVVASQSYGQCAEDSWRSWCAAATGGDGDVASPGDLADALRGMALCTELALVLLLAVNPVLHGYRICGFPRRETPAESVQRALEAMRKLPRHEELLEELAGRAVPSKQPEPLTSFERFATGEQPAQVELGDWMAEP